MRIGIDVSQLAHPNTGVSSYLGSLVIELVKDQKHEYILFFSSLRGKLPEEITDLKHNKNVRIKTAKIPPTILHYLWNVTHTLPIEKFTGPLDLFITSDWTEPPSKAKKATILYDLIVYKYPDETSNNIVRVQKKKLAWVKKESEIIFCISESTKNDAYNILGIDSTKLKVIYPGLTL
jgi:hypothetical protein